ncbi:MAG: hypothetical protein ACXV5L_08705 [Thermoanaerobaculia bacterium]
MSWQPAAAERLAAIAERAGRWRANGWIFADQKRRIETAAAGPWRRHSLPLAITFFLLTCLGVTAFSIFLELIHLPYGPITLVVCLTCAELLIYFYHFERTGVESALWIAGLFAFIISLPSQQKPEAILAFAAAALVAGARLRNAVFIALAAVLVDVYIDTKTHDPRPTIAFALIVTAGAAIALLRTWRRPSTELMLSLLVVVMPATAYLSTKVGIPIGIAGVVLLAAGFVIRHRAFLISGALAIALATYELQERIAWSVEVKLMVAGAIVFAIAVLLARLWRHNTRGFVTEKTAERFEVMQIAGAIHVSGAPAPAPAQPHMEPGGGSFGGGGATGDV